MAGLIRRAHAAVPNEEGVTLVEFALAASVFMSLIFSIVQFGALIWHYNMAADLAQEGARYASVRGASNTSSCATFTDVSCQATAAQVKTYVANRSFGTVVTSDVTFSGLKSDGTTSATDPSGVDDGGTVTVTVVSKFTPSVPFMSWGRFSLTSTAKMTMLY